MADYYPLIARAVEALDKNTSEQRRALYERARTALVAQLRGVTPPLDESEITRERLALEEAIRKIEADSARRAREDRPAAPRATPVAPASQSPAPASERQAQNRPAAPARTADAPSRATAERPAMPRASSLSEQALKGFRDGITAPAPVSATPTPAAPAAAPRPAAAPTARRPAPPPRPTAPPSPTPEPHPLQEFGELEPRVEPEQWSEQRTSRPARPRPSDIPEARATIAGRPRPARRAVAEEEPEEETEAAPRRTRLPLSFSLGRYLRYAAIAAVLLLVVGAGAFFWDTIRGSVGGLFSRSPNATQQQANAPARSTKIPDRIGQPSGLPSVAQRAVLYEEDPDDPQGKRYVGTAVWRTEMVAAAPGRAPELTVRADIAVPDRNLSVTLSIRRNSDQSLPASHTIELAFNLPQQDASGGVQNVPGVLMKQAESTRGTPLAGLAVKVTPGFFLIGLSALESDMQRNLQLLKERGWFDIPIVYASNRRAILAMEKGTPGEQAFTAAFTAWKQ